MFEEVKKELLGPHSSDMESNSNDMSDFGNNATDAVNTFNTDGSGLGNDSSCSADSGIGDGCGNASDAGCGMSM